jgi:hypothetical protein
MSNNEIKAYVVIYWETEYLETCTNSYPYNSKKIIGVAISRELAQEIVKEDAGTLRKYFDYDIEEFTLEAGSGTVIIE